MTNKQIIQEAIDAIDAYCRKYTPKERFRHMVEDGIINEKGEVLVTRADREAGHPIDDPPRNGSSPSSTTS